MLIFVTAMSGFASVEGLENHEGADDAKERPCARPVGLSFTLTLLPALLRPPVWVPHQHRAALAAVLLLRSDTLPELGVISHGLGTAHRAVPAMTLASPGHRLSC